MLARTGFRNNSGLAHVTREQGLAYAVINFVGTCMIKIFSFQPYLGATSMIGEALRQIQGRSSSNIMLKVRTQFGKKLRIGF